MANGSVVAALADTTRHPLRAAAAVSGARARSDAATTPSVRGVEERTRTAGIASTCAGSCPLTRTPSRSSGGIPDGGREGDRAEQAPGVPHSTDERRTAGRAAMVGSQERAWIAGHRAILPVEPDRGLAVRRPR